MKSLKKKLIVFFFPTAGRTFKVFPNNDFILANLKGLGLEIGPLSTPLKLPKARMLYADIATAKESRKALDKISSGGELYTGTLCEIDYVLNPPKFAFDQIPNNSFDFVFSSHVLEHSNNILFALTEQIRIIKKWGLIYFVIPNREKTYDKEREPTSFNFLLTRFLNLDFEIPPELTEDLLMNTIDHPLYNDKSSENLKKMLDEINYLHHYFVYDLKNTFEIINYLSRSNGITLEYFFSENENLHFMLRKTNEINFQSLEE